MMFSLTILILLLLLAPATLFLTAYVLRVSETTFTRSVITSIVWMLVGLVLSLVFDLLFPVQHPNLLALIHFAVGIFIVSWQFDISIIQSIVVTLLWSLSLVFMVVLLSFLLGIGLPKQMMQMMDHSGFAVPHKTQEVTNPTMGQGQQRSKVDD